MSSTIAVIGQTRSGTSMVAQMLAAAGLKVAGPSPSYEDDRSWGHSGDAGWWDEFDAVKFVDPHSGETWFTEARFPRRIVIVRRDADAQAHSFNKLMKVCGVRESPIKLIRKSIRKIRPWYDARGRTDGALKLVFEDVLADPVAAGQRIVEFLGQGDPEKVAAVVVSRGPGCYPGMLELALMQGGEE